MGRGLHQPAGLRLEGITLAPANQRALFEPFSLDVGAGEITTLMGPSGIGKSMLLRFICGTLPADFNARGQVWVDGVDVTALAVERRQIGILFQNESLFPHWSVIDNLLFALAPRHARRERRPLAFAALERAGLSALSERDPATLSGGQRARIALLRTLLAEPKVLLLDEPFSPLDGANRQAFREFVFEHARESSKPTLMVTHDREDAEAAGGAVVELTRLDAAQRE